MVYEGGIPVWILYLLMAFSVLVLIAAMRRRRRLPRSNNQCRTRAGAGVVLIISLTFFLTAFTVVQPVHAQADWWDTDWYVRRIIEIDHTKVTDNLENFPVLIYVDVDLSKAQVDGGDFVFVDNENNVLDHEIENFNSDNLTAWVRIPSLSSSDNTTIYIYYGNISCGNQENAEGVWDANYLGVYHNSTDWLDSTSNDRDGTAIGNPSHIIGKIAGCGSFYQDKVRISNALDNLDNFTIELWAKPSSLTGDRGIFGPYSQQIIFYWDNPNGWRVIVIRGGNNSDSGYGGGGSVGVWEYVALRSIRNDNEYVYLDGSLATKGGGVDNDVDSTDNNYYGWSDGTRWWHGQIDEVRVSNIARSVGWVETSYNNQDSPSTFIEVGDEELLPPTKPELDRPIENQPYFEWSGMYAENYRLLVDNDSDFSSPRDNFVVAQVGEENINQETGTLYTYLYSGAFISLGLRRTFTHTRITAVGFKLRKFGSPTGNITFTVRAASDNSIIQSEVWGDASQLLSASPRWENAVFSSPVWKGNEDIRVLCEYSGGDSSNKVFVYWNPSPVSGELRTAYKTGNPDYTDYSVSSAIYRLTVDVKSFPSYYQTLPENAYENDAYYWKVIASNMAGENESDVWRFVVGIEPGVDEGDILATWLVVGVIFGVGIGGYVKWKR